MILAHYESIRQASHRMLEAARRSDWEAVARAEVHVGALIDRLRAAGDPRQSLDGEGRKRRFEILHDVLADDAEIRNLAQPWLREADRALGLPSRSPGGGARR